MKKLKDVIVYKDDTYYSAFPSVVVRNDGEIICAFRRAPDKRRLWNAPSNTHTDPNSYLVLVRSTDGGQTWTEESELIYAHPMGGSQDPCMVQLSDGSIVCASYGWAELPSEAAEMLPDTLAHPPFYFMGGYVLRSDDGGQSWKGPFIPPSIQGDITKDIMGKPCPTFNRGAMVQGKDGKLYWAVVGIKNLRTHLSGVHLLVSSDRGETWNYSCPIAEDENITFSETSLIQTEKGDFVAFMRTNDFDDKLAVSRSTDGGKSFKWEDGQIMGHPYHAIHIPDGRVLLVYGYRHEPFGIRARLLNSDCTNITASPEFIIREDGGNFDLGYPWAALLPDGNVLVAYYFNVTDGTRHIAGSILDVS